MKYCLINNLYRPYIRGGAERVVEKIAIELQEKGNEVFVITLKPMNAPDLPPPLGLPLGQGERISPPLDLHPPKADFVRQGEKNNFTLASAEERVYYLKSRFFDLEKIPLFLRFFWHLWDEFNFVNYFKIKKILKKEKSDIVWTHNIKGLGAPVISLPGNLKIKHYHTLHDIQLLHPSGLMFYGKEGIINTPWAKIYQALNKFFIKNPDKVFSPSAWLMGVYKNRGFFKKSETEVIPNFEIKTLPLRQLADFPCKGERVTFNFFYVGQIEEHKGVRMLIEVFKELPQKNIKLTLIGPGSILEEIKKMSFSDKRIIILGQRPNSEVLEVMKNSDYLIVPSLCYENSPTVIYEAAKIGLPIIASNIGGIPELVEKIGGDLFKPEKEELKKILLSKIK